MNSSMTKLLEICVDSAESAISAAEAGADRLELCSALSEGGLTPTTSLLKVLKKNVNIPIFCMVRPRSGPMQFSDLEKEIMLMEAKELKDAGADGLVFGALTVDRKVDVEFSKKFIEVAEGLPCTFHRAFDLTTNPLAELDVVISLGFTRILTSGCKSSAIEGAPLLRELVNLSNGRIIIMAGAGIRSSNCLNLISSTGVTEVHSSAKTKKIYSVSGPKQEAQMGDNEDNLVFVASSEEVRLLKESISRRI